VVDNCAEIGKMKIKEGSIMEHIPAYNDFFNKGKKKIFPLQSLEEIVQDPSKFNHTLKIVNENLKTKSSS
jgi:hypothetical protein